ncbi:ABC transporter permease, partial [Streptomyces europaeiscabiei]|nr:ABC transporter permease [Streptomyces europaeiscabiei]
MSATTDVTDPATSVAPETTGDTRRGLDLGRFRELSLVPAILVLGLIGFIVSPAFLTAD